MKMINKDDIGKREEHTATSFPYGMKAVTQYPSFLTRHGLVRLTSSIPVEWQLGTGAFDDHVTEETT